MKLDSRNPRDQFLVGHVIVTMDGRDRTRRCVAADDTAGWILTYAEDENGNIKVDRRNNEALCRKEYGRVRVVLKPTAQAQILHGLAIRVYKNRYKNLVR